MNWQQTRPVQPSQTAARTAGVAVCLGSAFLGFYTHAGFLRGLAEQGVLPERLAGCSGGAIVAGLCAGGVAAEDVPDVLASMPMPGTFFDRRVGLHGFAMLANLSGFSGMIRGDRLLKFLKGVLGDRRIEDLASPRLAIAVSDLEEAASAMLESGPLAEAIVASCAIPLLIKSVKIDGRHYCDGGVANALPIEHLAAEPDIHTVIVHRIAHPGEKRLREKAASPSAAAACNIAAHIIYKRIHQFALEKLTMAGKRVIYCETVTSIPSVFLGKKSRLAYVEAGARTAEFHRADWDALTGRKSESTPTSTL
jgi:NTE family protein